MNWEEFWLMGGYARFVWPSYALTLAVLVANAWWPWWRGRQLRRQLTKAGERT